MKLPKKSVNKLVPLRVSETRFVMLRDVSASRSRALRELIKEEVSDREFAVRFLQIQLQSYRTSTLERVETWSDKFLLYAIHRWCLKGSMKEMVGEEYEDLDQEFADFESTPSFSKFRSLLGHYIMLLHLEVQSVGSFFVPDLSKAIQAYRTPLMDTYRALNLGATFNNFALISKEISQIKPIIDAAVNSSVLDSMTFANSIKSTIALNSKITNRLLEDASRTVKLASLPWMPSNFSNYHGLSIVQMPKITPRFEYGQGVDVVGLMQGTLAQINHNIGFLPKFSNLVASVNLNLNSTLNEIARLQRQSLASDIYSSEFRDWLSRASRDAERYVVIWDANDVLRQSGYGFLVGFVGFAMAELITSYAQGNRSGAITKQFLKFTASEDFLRHMEIVVRSSPAGERRWKAIRQALSAHNNKEYYNSIPTLLSILEGLVNDCLMKRQLAFNRGNKMIRKGRDGRPMGGNLNGLQSKLQHLDRETQGANHFPAYLEEWVPPKRNRVLHGNQTAYGKSDLSVKLVFLVLLYADQLTDENHGFFM